MTLVQCDCCWNGERCNFIGTKQQVTVHKRKHTDRHPVYDFLPNNECPYCRAILKDKRCVHQHFSRTIDRHAKGRNRYCVTKNMNKGRPYRTSKMNNFYCKECDCNIKGYEEIMKHSKAHLEQILDRGHTDKITDKETRPIVQALLKGAGSGSLKGLGTEEPEQVSKENRKTGTDCPQEICSTTS